ncbi:hypothetical protein BGZ73_002918 [Actinomortierella ambigua]|nr:hypothetical protein BGZ73_002918 [Actinomortierella ambigua]
MQYRTTLSSIVFFLVAFLQQLVTVVGAKYRIAHASTGMMVSYSGSSTLSVRPASSNDGRTEVWDTQGLASDKEVRFRNVAAERFAFGRIKQMDILLESKYASSWVLRDVGGDNVVIKHKSEPLYWKLQNNVVVLADDSKGVDQWRLTGA